MRLFLFPSRCCPVQRCFPQNMEFTLLRGVFSAGTLAPASSNECARGCRGAPGWGTLVASERGGGDPATHQPGAVTWGVSRGFRAASRAGGHIAERGRGSFGRTGAVSAGVLCGFWAASGAGSHIAKRRKGALGRTGAVPPAVSCGELRLLSIAPLLFSCPSISSCQLLFCSSSKLFLVFSSLATYVCVC